MPWGQRFGRLEACLSRGAADSYAASPASTLQVGIALLSKSASRAGAQAGARAGDGAGAGAVLAFFLLQRREG